MIALYIYRISDGMFLYEDSGSPNDITRDLGMFNDFTMQSLPDHNHQWYWIDNAWQSSPKQQ